MKTKHLISTIAFLLAGVISSAAQDVAQMDTCTFHQYVKTLFNQGQAAYLKSDRLTTKRCYEQMERAINARNLSQDVANYLKQYVLKLKGDYHYDNADYCLDNPSKYNNSLDSAANFFKEALLLSDSDVVNYTVKTQNQCVLHMELAQVYYKKAYHETDAMKRKTAFADALNEMQIAERQARPFHIQTTPDTLDVCFQATPDTLGIYFQATAGLAMCYARVGEYGKAHELIDEQLGIFENTDSVRYGELRRRKAKVIMLQMESGDTSANISEALDSYKRYFTIKRRDALANFANMESGQREQYWMNIRPFVTDCYRLEDIDPAFLYDVTLFAKGLLLQLNRDGGGARSLSFTWQQIQQRLPEDGCAIEFVQYEKGGSQHMGGLVLGKTGHPRFVHMMDPDSVMGIKISYTTVREILERGVKDKKSQNNLLYADTSSVSKIWNDQLIEAIGKARKVYFAPDGYMHQIAVEYILPQQLKDISFYRLTSTRRLMDDSPTVKGASALIIGDVDYKADITGEPFENDRLAFEKAQGLPFKQLDSLDVREIRELRKCETDKLLVRAEATESSFRSLCHDYSILHLSTHGVFKAAGTPEGTDLKPCLTDESLSECFVALAGAEHAVRRALDAPPFNPEYQDGILSAKEIASLDMSRAQLVVLSCCETALGYVTPDGVYGIQRGLKNAGAGAIIVTLWDIFDVASGFFMVTFHDFLAKGQTIHQAFYNTRQTMRNIEDYSSPVNVDAFILIDALD